MQAVTLLDYQSALKAHLAARVRRTSARVDHQEIERWRQSLTGLSNRSKNKLLIQMHGLFRRVMQVRITT